VLRREIIVIIFVTLREQVTVEPEHISNPGLAQPGGQPGFRLSFRLLLFFVQWPLPIYGWNIAP
jgi:hypothetical protein